MVMVGCRLRRQIMLFSIVGVIRATCESGMEPDAVGMVMASMSLKELRSFLSAWEDQGSDLVAVIILGEGISGDIGV